MMPPPVTEEFRHVPDAAGRKRQVVLTVEDDPDDWQIYGKILWYNGFDVLHAETAEEGLRMAVEYHPDVVLADLMLPRMSGIEMCKALRERPETREIPVVVLTARREREFGDQAREAGCERFIEKPVGPVDVLHVVEEIVGRPPPPVD